jgi:hypothetical protein
MEKIAFFGLRCINACLKLKLVVVFFATGDVEILKPC